MEAEKSSSSVGTLTYEKGGEIHKVENFGRDIPFFDPHGETMKNRFRIWCKTYPKNNALAFRKKLPDGSWGEYVYSKFSDFETSVNNLASGLRHIGLNKGDHIGILSKNCPEWLIFDMACAVQGFVSVPIYDSYGKEIDTHLINHSDCTALFVDAEHVQMAAELRATGKIPLVKTIIGIDNQTTFGKKFDDMDYLFSQIIETGKEHRFEDAEIFSEDIYTIVYTSGTSGDPKGVVLSNENICSGYMMMGSKVAPDFEKGKLLSYLPLAHVFDRTIEYAHLEKGACVGYFHGEMTQLVSDMKVFRPNTLTGVPRSLTKMYEAITNNINKLAWIKKKMFWYAYDWKRKLPYERRIKCDTWADKIFKSVRDVVGGQVKIVISGAAALKPEIAEFLHVVLAVPFGEGYGQTETSCGITGPHVSGTHFGEVGIPFSYVEVRLESIPEMGYLTTDTPHPRGEILCRGPNVFKGYYKDDEATKKVFLEDGFYRTGDVGEWVPGPYTKLGPLKKGKDGKVKEGEKEREPGEPIESLRIIDRRNNMCKMARGEFVSVDVLERMYDSVSINGDAKRNLAKYVAAWVIAPPIGMEFLVAFVCPKWEALLDESNAKETGSDKWPGVKEWWVMKKGGYSNSVTPVASPAKTPSESASPASSYESSGEKSNASSSAPEKAVEADYSNSQSSPTASPAANSIVVVCESVAPVSTETQSSSSNEIPESIPAETSDSSMSPAPQYSPPSVTYATPVAGNGISEELKRALCQSPAVKQFYLNYFKQLMAKALSAGQVKRYEVIAGVILCAEDWSPENGLTTASLKTRRNTIKQFYLERYDREVETLLAERKTKGASADAPKTTKEANKKESSVGCFGSKKKA
ncbi:putative long-chain acyl-CoA synthetase 7 [Monocercomonoides exilis]|uniref:putative long-chain acyl-CoA synthetase 7 n=1 Tax=Monocercomonoides exilis TaxID=2049356 RepID=UPI003559DC67|nr:putative long-chain acyl-CoA synthetase 7 [Monocercomonoides exilis]|eukprot:MONOS_684.1-p1 / transcript=MONOS_684.1 / gene=MONOS_684 / organism=Monocercomonoides_exilis_PA203 / gene_product=long-chain acyl-CoA synthetase 7 / transcript_product=long-chain acyl-CoA synthetase 7 / location=Mono_scaffold00011:160366-162957(+) / protein_length=863 / sequence_SO=supercontig / SO=protein_coding / is_pseudo=false